MISLYEKSKKELMLKRRDAEKAWRQKKKSPNYRKLVHIGQHVMQIMDEFDKKEEEKQRYETAAKEKEGRRQRSYSMNPQTSLNNIFHH